MACAGKGKFYKQERVKQLGKTGQETLAQATVAIVGIGGLGCICADTLTRMGIGRLMLFDEDEIELSNLHRQILYTENDIGAKKTAVAQKKLYDINPETKVNIFPKVTKDNVDILEQAQVILDCTDSMSARHLLDAYAATNQKRIIYAMAAGTSGYVYAYEPKKSKAFTKIFSKEKKGEDCETLGILPTQLHVVTAVQINICLKMLTNQAIPHELIHIDGWDNKITSIKTT